MTPNVSRFRIPYSSMRACSSSGRMKSRNRCVPTGTYRKSHSSKTLPTISESSVRLTVSYRDRKSTRLNSSHVRISYAVFCLKKKKKNQTFIHDITTTIIVYIKKKNIIVNRQDNQNKKKLKATIEWNRSRVESNDSSYATGMT